MGYCDEGMINVQHIREPVRLGNGEIVHATKKGTKLVTVIQENGTRTDTEMSPYKYIPPIEVQLVRSAQPIGTGLEHWQPRNHALYGKRWRVYPI